MNTALIQRHKYVAGDRFHFALFSDLHLDSTHHNRKKFLEDMEDAKAHGARIFLNGDIFDFILPGDRKRYTRGSDDSDVDDILGKIIQQGVEILKPYVNQIDLIGMGNHETAVLKIHHLDAVRWLIIELQRLRDPKLPRIHHGGYTGFIRLQFEHKAGGQGRGYTIWYHHGTGGSSPVTKGMIDFNRAQIRADADLYWMGHKHTSITDDGIKQLYIDQNGSVKVREKMAVFTGGYKLAASLDRDYMQTGYLSDYSEEAHLGTQADGYKLLTIEPLINDTDRLRARITRR